MLAVSAVAVDRLRGAPAVVVIRCWRPGEGPDLLHRANTDPVGLTQRPVDRAGLGHPHLRPADQVRGVGGIGIAVADKALAFWGLEDSGLERPSGCRCIREFGNRLSMNPGTATPSRQSDQPCVGYIPSAL